MKVFLPLLLILGVFVITLASCSSSEKSSENMKVEEAPPPLSPGTASVEAEIISISEKEGVTQLKLKILKVLAYGSSTPSLSENVEMETSLSKSLSKNNNLESGKKYMLLLRSGSQLGEESKDSEWQISKIN